MPESASTLASPRLRLHYRGLADVWAACRDCGDLYQYAGSRVDRQWVFWRQWSGLEWTGVEWTMDWNGWTSSGVDSQQVNKQQIITNHESARWSVVWCGNEMWSWSCESTSKRNELGKVCLSSNHLLACGVERGVEHTVSEWVVEGEWSGGVWNWVGLLWKQN